MVWMDWKAVEVFTYWMDGFFVSRRGNYSRLEVRDSFNRKKIRPIGRISSFRTGDFT